MTDLTILGMVLNLVVLVAAAVWGVSKVKAQTMYLAGELRHLSNSIDRLSNKLEAQEAKLGTLGERVATLEGIKNKA